MSDLTLKQKFKIGLILVVVVALNTLWGLRLMGKGALFHYLERNHIENVMRIELNLRLAEAGGKAAENVRREDVIKLIKTNIELEKRAIEEVFYVEQMIFRAMGFSDVFDAPAKGVGLHTTMIDILAKTNGSSISPEEAAGMRPQMEEILKLSNVFVVLVKEAVVFIKNLV